MIDSLLIRSRREVSPTVALALLAQHAWTRLSIRQTILASTKTAEDGKPATYIRIDLTQPQILSARDCQSLQASWRASDGNSDECTRLERLLDLPGVSPDQPALVHYAVETDPAPGWSEDISRWYAEEHLPGLAAVPGCIRASRYLSLDAGPRSVACYDLSDLSVLGTDAWMRVRQTVWSDRCRPHFTNTLRTRFQSRLDLGSVGRRQAKPPTL